MLASIFPLTVLKRLLLFIVFVALVLWGSRRTIPTAGSAQVLSPSLSSQLPKAHSTVRKENIFPQLNDRKQLQPQPVFEPGITKPPGSNYSRVLVVPRLRVENTEWIRQQVPDVQEAVYVVDDPTNPLHPPKNKGHEVMVYLTYIIDHYENLPDIMIYMHSHQFSWHNEEPLNFDAGLMLRRLSSEHITRVGFMNLRCFWGPGCPDWMRPRGSEGSEEKKEETLIAQSWSEIFPFEPVPEVLAQPCCAQFAVSRDRVVSVPKSRYIFYRDWLLRTDLDDYISGRVWEYLWQVVFTGQSVVCPDERICYCEGYGLCFNRTDFDELMGLIFQMRDLQGELGSFRQKAEAIDNARRTGNLEELGKLDAPDYARKKVAESELIAKFARFRSLRDEGLKRGDDPKTRAQLVGRSWKEGDGF